MDQAVIQKAIDTLGPEGGIVTLEPVEYHIRADLNLRNGTILQGAGSATRLILANGISVIVSSKSNVRIRDLVIDADAHAHNQRAVVVANSHDVAIEQCWVLNCGGFGIFLSGNQGTETGKVRVSNCRLTGKGRNDIIGGGPMTTGSTVSEVIVTGNYIRQDNTSSFYRNAIDIVACTRSIIANNIVEGSIVLGGEKIPHVQVDVSHNTISPAINASFCQLTLLAGSDAGQAENSHSIRFIGNDITSGQIYVQGQKATGNRTYRVIVQNNIVKGLSTHPDPGVNRGIVISHARDVLVDGNIVDGATKALVAGDVLMLRIGSSNHLINYSVAFEKDSKTTLST